MAHPLRSSGAEAAPVPASGDSEIRPERETGRRAFVEDLTRTFLRGLL